MAKHSNQMKKKLNDPNDQIKKSYFNLVLSFNPNEPPEKS